jgi:Flp pilus assembly protein TadB
VSKQRQAARAERERKAAEAAATRDAEARRAASARAKRKQRALGWRRLRLWQHGPGFRRDTWGAFGTVILLILLTVWLFSRSLTAVLVTALALVVCAPVLALLFFDRRDR